MGAADTVGRLAKHRAEMSRAIAENVSLAEARRRLAQDASREAAARLAARQCGTVIPGRDRGDLPQQWWQRD